MRRCMLMRIVCGRQTGETDSSLPLPFKKHINDLAWSRLKSSPGEETERETREGARAGLTSSAGDPCWADIISR